MKKYLKITLLLIILVLSLSPFFMDTVVFAQVKPPTLLPSDDVSIGSTCVGLATMIRTGNIHLSSIPCFIKYFTQTLVGLGGSLSVIFVMYGGYRYVISTDDSKDKAKKTITFALVGLAVSLMAWVIIDLVLQVATE